MTKHYEKQCEFCEMEIESILYATLSHVTDKSANSGLPTAQYLPSGYSSNITIVL